MPWRHLYLKQEFQVYKRVTKQKTQLFTLNERGFGRVYDDRKKQYFSGGVKFPTGRGWKVGKWVEFNQTVWRKGRSKTRKTSILIEKLDFDDKGWLQSMTYLYAVDGRPDHKYVYEPNRGMVSLTKLSSLSGSIEKYAWHFYSYPVYGYSTSSNQPIQKPKNLFKMSQTVDLRGHRPFSI